MTACYRIQKDELLLTVNDVDSHSGRSDWVAHKRIDYRTASYNKKFPTTYSTLLAVINDK